MNLDKLVEFEKMSTRESFEMMEEFIDTVEDENFKQKLIYALNRNKPFRNFKYEIDYSDEYRQRWFKFKEEKYLECVEKKAKTKNNER